MKYFQLYSIHKGVYGTVSNYLYSVNMVHRGGSRTAATSKIELFVIIANGWKPLTIITKCSILDVVAVLDPPLVQDNNAI